MAVSSLKNMLVLLMMLVIFSMGVDCRNPVLHRVGGGKYTWKLHTDFNEWASHEQFYVGDWLYFGFNKTLYNVLEVNKTSYEKCIAKGYITNITKGGRDVFNLTDARSYYFISSRAYGCFKGMKLAIKAQFAPPDPILPTSVSSLSNTCAQKIFVPVLIYAVIASIYLFKFI